MVSNIATTSAAANRRFFPARSARSIRFSLTYCFL